MKKLLDRKFLRFKVFITHIADGTQKVRLLLYLRLTRGDDNLSKLAIKL